MGSAVSPMSRVREIRAKVVLCIYMKLVKGTRGTNVRCLLAIGQRRWNLVTSRRERQSAKQLVTLVMRTCRKIIKCLHFIYKHDLYFAFFSLSSSYPYFLTPKNYCVRGTRTRPLICVGCSVHYWVSCAINEGGFFEIAFSSSPTHICLALRRLLTFSLTLTR